jgi:hypothetical protein
MADVEPQETQPDPPPPPENEETPGGEPALETPETPPAEPAVELSEEDEDDTPEEPEAKRRRTGGFQRKIEKLERERDALLQRVLSQEQPRTQPAAATEPEQTPQEKAAAYIQGEVRREMERAEHARQQQTLAADWAQRTEAVRAKYPDFDERVRSVNVPPDSLLGQALLTSEHGPEILYAISEPSELARLGALPMAAAIREVGRLEAKLASVAPTPSGTQKPTARRPPPTPITPVTARGPTNVKPVGEMNFEEYRAWRLSQQRDKR